MKPSITRRRWIALSVTAACVPVSGSGAASPDRIRRHGTGAEGFFANTYLFENDRACLLIDAHLNGSEANAVAALIERTGKPLTAIVITHPHPDHYLGLEMLGPRFPDATVYSSPGALTYVRQAARYWAGFRNPLAELAQGPVTLADRSFECMLLPDAESPAPVVLFDPHEKTLVAGDHVLNAQHHWLVEGRAAAWRSNLATIRARWDIETVLPGHGPIGGPEIIDISDTYIDRFLKLQAAGTAPQTALQVMAEAYPDFVFRRALDVSIAANF